MKKINEPLKNVIAEDMVKKDGFGAFMNHFKHIKKVDSEFYKYDNRNVDYSYIQGEAKRAGIQEIPSKEELSKLT